MSITLLFFSDEPMFTQPIMYSIIKKHPDILSIYSKQLTGEGLVTKEEVDSVIDKYDKICEDAFKKVYILLQVFKVMKSNSLLGPFGDSEFWGFSLLKIQIGWVAMMFQTSDN